MSSLQRGLTPSQGLARFYNKQKELERYGKKNRYMQVIDDCSTNHHQKRDSEQT
jgi:hypothetical protein